MQLVLLYSFFAAIATLANIGAQDLTTRVYGGPWHIVLSVLVGTGVGLVVKYVLDKKWIFRFKAENARHDATMFTLYVTMGLVTTAIFWGVEFAFEHIFGTATMRYVGACIGLAIGYVIKYRLDKRYVFRSFGGEQPALAARD
ncbi:GtrA family protein [Caballeronia sp. LZ065]|uniref:GtrA family protein n=1 Tax=Caballeronia sp. LZ065 TaxID=3038571 RepID=UPI0028619534|nr:GtrA family protein [Caballeronia sp. LZ065]MDR5780158.1 GtrA family protein [Caballeronia sp. LZ065]